MNTHQVSVAADTATLFVQSHFNLPSNLIVLN